MQAWQEHYLRNVREAAEIQPLFGTDEQDFEAWHARHFAAEERLRALREENNRLLTEHLFPTLDALHSAPPETLEDLDAFADRLMDWQTNLDCGTYVAIHDALLNLHRHRRDRDGIIRELYKLGMGLFYLQRAILGVTCREADSMRFEDELLFTEAAAYLRHFEAIPGDASRGYIIRAMANVSLCAKSYKRRINACMKTIAAVTDPEMRAIAPSLPWDVFLSRVRQQLSSLRTSLSEKEITPVEVAAVMDACYEVFKPEHSSDRPNIRWLWPYYEMEFHCGYVGLDLTVERLERLIRETPMAAYDMNGLYGNVQLPILLGRMLRDHEKLRQDRDRRRFLDFAYRKMLDTLMTIPPAQCNDHFTHVLTAVVTDFYELEDCISYREITTRLMQRFAGRLYLRSLLAGELLLCVCRHVLSAEPDFFARLPLDPAGGQPSPEAVLRYAEDCALYHDFGLFKMRMERMERTRSLYENEDAMRRLHTVSGYEDLRLRRSTAAFADVARGHHSAYTGGARDVSGYRRMDSPWRQMTDLMAILSDLLDSGNPDVAAWARSVRGRAQRQYSPRAFAYFEDASLQEALSAILSADGKDRARRAYQFYYGHHKQGDTD